MFNSTFCRRFDARSYRSTTGKWHLVIALIVGVFFLGVTSLPSAAQTETTAVSGYSNSFGGPQVNDSDAGSVHVDAAGNLHYQRLKVKGHFQMSGDGIDIVGTQTAWITAVKDSNGDGAASARIVVESPQGEMLWVGNLHGHFDAHYLTGSLILQGRGPYNGLTARLEVQEECVHNPDCSNPSEYVFSGTVLSRPGL